MVNYRGNPLEALKLGLQNPPFQGSPAEKVRYLAVPAR